MSVAIFSTLLLTDDVRVAIRCRQVKPIQRFLSCPVLTAMCTPFAPASSEGNLWGDWKRDPAQYGSISDWYQHNGDFGTIGLVRQISFESDHWLIERVQRIDTIVNAYRLQPK
jgi:hypothetical protein